MTYIKKGFTLVELLAVIVVLSMIMALGIGVISSSAKDTNDKIYETKKTNIENAAILYGQDNFKSEKITVSGLADAGYIKYDTIDDKGNGIVTDPRGKRTSLNDCEITISVNTTTRTVGASMSNCD